MIIAAVFILGIGVWMYMPHLVDYGKNANLNRKLREQYVKPADGVDGNSFSLVSDETESETGEEGVRDQNQKMKTEANKIAEKYPPLKINGKSLKKENPDYVGWIYVPGTGISYPVVYAEDYNKYMHTAFDGSYNYAGTIFFDQRNKNTTDEKHAILYGHNMRDGSMFAKIKNYNDREYFEKHPVFWFITPTSAQLYQIFSAYEAQPRDFDVTYSVEGDAFSTDEEYEQVLHKMKNNSVIDTGTFATYKDNVMTMSTCTNARTSRFTVHGYLIGSLAA